MDSHKNTQSSVTWYKKKAENTIFRPDGLQSPPPNRNNLQPLSAVFTLKERGIALPPLDHRVDDRQQRCAQLRKRIL